MTLVIAVLWVFSHLGFFVWWNHHQVYFSTETVFWGGFLVQTNKAISLWWDWTSIQPNYQVSSASLGLTAPVVRCECERFASWDAAKHANCIWSYKQSCDFKMFLECIFISAWYISPIINMVMRKKPICHCSILNCTQHLLPLCFLLLLPQTHLTN